jgi:hypothetical protein
MLQYRISSIHSVVYVASGLFNGVSRCGQAWVFSGVSWVLFRTPWPPSPTIHYSSIKRPYLRGKQTQILRGQQRGNGSAKMISMTMQFIIINLKKKYRINSFLMQELKLYMA